MDLSHFPAELPKDTIDPSDLPRMLWLAKWDSAQQKPSCNSKQTRKGSDFRAQMHEKSSAVELGHVQVPWSFRDEELPTAQSSERELDQSRKGRGKRLWRCKW